MMRITRWVEQTLILATLATPVAAQPTQFKANVMSKDGDGKIASGTVYFGGAKIRTELTSDGQNMVALIDPAAKMQYVLMPSEKVYMQMPIGQGPGSIMVIYGPSDPTNPCASGSGNTNCVRGGTESVNGYETVRWNYTNSAGEGTRAWVSTRLRFPIKTQVDDGSTMEFSNIAEGPQPANLFAIPAGYQKVDIGAMGGMGAVNGRGRGKSPTAGPTSAGNRGDANDPIAAAMANVPPEMRAAAAAAMRGQMPAGMGAAGPSGRAGTPAPTGSAWERPNGFTVNITVTATQTEGPTTQQVLGGSVTDQSSYSIKWVGAVPLNTLTRANGLPGSPGPMWTLVPAMQGMGNAAANKMPVTLSVTTAATSDYSTTSDCKTLDETGHVSSPYIRQGRMNSATQRSIPLSDFSVLAAAQGQLTLSADLKTYDLVAGIKKVEGQEVTKNHTDVTGCKDKKVQREDEPTTTRTADYSFHLELTREPLPATMSTISGSKKMPVQIDGRTLNATVTWTIAPIP
jgi:hypothetical protein